MKAENSPDYSGERKSGLNRGHVMLPLLGNKAHRKNLETYLEKAVD